MAQIFKIKYKDTFRRISIPQGTNKDADGFNFEDLELKVRDLFQIPRKVQVILTYTDGEGDVITMTDSQDLRDAWHVQKLQPLKLEVKTVPVQMSNEPNGKELGLNFAEFNVEALLKGLFPGSITQAIDEVLSRYPPSLFASVPAHVLPEALDTFLGTLVAHSSQNAAKLQRGNHIVAPGVAVHKYIECDICFMCPIVGPRYKSIQKHDYDLCSNCFEKFGNEADYRKLDRPLIIGPNSVENKHGVCSFPSRANHIQGRFDGFTPTNDSVVKDLKRFDRLLDAEFVKDVTVLDGSKVEVGSSFTKVWRLKNCGSIPWPEFTKLAHIGGAALGSKGAVALQLPEGGLSINSEFDVSVELKVPESSGQYISKWQLQVPSGQSFGHSVWVHIEAIPVFDKSHITHELSASFSDKDLKDCSSDEPEFGSLIHANEVKTGDMGGLRLGEMGLKTDCDSSKWIEEQGETDGFSILENMVEGLGECEGAEEFELISPRSHELVFRQWGVKQDDAKVEVQQNRLSEEDTFSSTGWDHMLKELEELGFHGTQTNIKELLLRSEGSIKRAVKELVELEKQMSGKIKPA